MALGLGFGIWMTVSPATAQAPPPGYRPPPPGPAMVGGPAVLAGPAPTSMATPPAPTQMQSLLDAPGRVVQVDEYRIGETNFPGPVATVGEGAPAAANPVRVRFAAAVAYERGREEQRVRGLKVTIERPLPDGTVDEVSCYVDRGEMAPLAAALQQMADQCMRRGGGDRDEFYRRGRGRERDRASARFANYATADFAVTARFEPGRPVIFVRNPNRPDSRVSLGDESTAGVLEQWNDWVEAAQQVLDRK